MAPEINPETEEVVDEISRTTAMRVADDEHIRASRRATADIIATLEDKHYLRGVWLGFWIGVPIGVVLYKIYLAVWLWVGD